MKLTIKNLKQVIHDVEVESENVNVNTLKYEIEKKYGFDSKSLKLLFNGVVLEDSKLLSDYKIKEGLVLMMMNAKAKPQNIQSNVIPKEEKKTEELTDNNLNHNLVNSKKPKTAKKNPSVPTVEQKDYSNEIKQLTEMGFTEDMSKRAIISASGNVSMAIEYLYNGMPSSNNQHTNQVPLYSEFLDDEEEELEGVELDPELLENLDLTHPNALSNIASIVKVIINEDPAGLENLLNSIEETNPEIIDFIKENEAQFKTLIEKPINQADMQVFNSLMPGQNLQQGENEEDELMDEGILDINEFLNSQGGNSNQHTSLTDSCNLTDSEKEAVQRLVSLGFAELDVVQAYVACDKNEEMTANLLFENKFKDNDMNVDGKL